MFLILRPRHTGKMLPNRARKSHERGFYSRNRDNVSQQLRAYKCRRMSTYHYSSHKCNQQSSLQMGNYIDQVRGIRRDFKLWTIEKQILLESQRGNSELLKEAWIPSESLRNTYRQSNATECIGAVPPFNDATPWK